MNKTRNILFIERSLNPSNGGVERVTDIISKKLTSLNYHCYFLYCDEGNQAIPSKNKLKIKYWPPYFIFRIRIIRFIMRNHIDTIINQDIWTPFYQKLFEELKQAGMRLLFFHHLAPDGMERYSSKERRMRKIDSIKSLILKALNMKVEYKTYFRCMYNICDTLVLLSPSFINGFAEKYAINDKSKFRCIPNPLTFEENITFQELWKKEKIVLIVSRFVETQKNLTAAFRIWKLIEKATTDWRLQIIGYGDDEEYYKRYVKQLGLNHIEFLGKIDNVQAYYKRASVFIMTSHFEGFGMTLTESLQNGCVPLAFDTFTALHDILRDGYNGYIIPLGDEAGYAAKIIKLISDDTTRNTMAMNAVASSGAFSFDKIIPKWIALLEEV